MHPVQKSWVFHLPFRMQAVLMSATRGADGVPKEDKSKMIVRGLRDLLFNNADPTSSFMKGELTEEQIEAFASDIDHYHVHFLMHLTHAVEIVGYKHPDNLVRARWLAIYKRICKSLHLNFETENQLDVRLGHTEGWLEEQRKAAEKKPAAAAPVSVPKVTIDPEARKKAQAERPIELDIDDKPAKPAKLVDPKIECTCGHVYGEHYQPFIESKPDLYECQSGKCKCTSFQAKPPPKPAAPPAPKVSTAVAAPQITPQQLQRAVAAMGPLVTCVCNHTLEMHMVPNFSGSEQRCSSRGCHCMSFVNREGARRSGDAGLHLTQRRQKQRFKLTPRPRGGETVRQ